MYFEINGRKVFATTGGKPFDNSKPTVVFLHGSGFDHTVWNLQSRFFAFRGYSVLALDLPGHTRSEASVAVSAKDTGFPAGICATLLGLSDPDPLLTSPTLV